LSPIASVAIITPRSCGVKRAGARCGRLDQRAFDRRRRAIGLQYRHQRFADLQLCNRGRDVDLRIGPEGFRRRFDRCLVARRKGVQLVLDAVVELPGNGVGNVDRVLRDEIDADAL
jgi:hypothetical protein